MRRSQSGDPRALCQVVVGLFVKLLVPSPLRATRLPAAACFEPRARWRGWGSHLTSSTPRWASKRRPIGASHDPASGDWQPPPLARQPQLGAQLAPQAVRGMRDGADGKNATRPAPQPANLESLEAA